MKGIKSNQIVAWPRLSKTDLLLFRIGGDGLGNLLFTWARCMSACRANGWQMIWPTWPSFKPKNWKANPYDKRGYMGLFKPLPGQIHGLRKLFEIFTRRWLKENEAKSRVDSSRALIVFRGQGNMFEDFLADQSWLKGQLLTMTCGRHLAGYLETDLPAVGIHVRRGDFTCRDNDSDTEQKANSSLPIQWYIDVLGAIRLACEAPVPAFVVSDGTDLELAQLLALENTRRVSYGSSIADLLTLSRASLLITSGSTFSMWASYLGQMPTIWHKGKKLQNLLINNPDREIEWAGHQPMPDWVPKLITGSREDTSSHHES